MLSYINISEYGSKIITEFGVLFTYISYLYDFSGICLIPFFKEFLGTYVSKRGKTSGLKGSSETNVRWQSAKVCSIHRYNILLRVEQMHKRRRLCFHVYRYGTLKFIYWENFRTSN